jgi:hypothetical protein
MFQMACDQFRLIAEHLQIIAYCNHPSQATDVFDGPMQDVYGQAEHGGVDEEQPARLRAVGVDLFAGEAHPRLRRAAADAAVDAGVEGGHPGLTDGAGLSEVAGDWFREVGQVGLGHDTGEERFGEFGCDESRVLGAVAGRAL